MEIKRITFIALVTGVLLLIPYFAMKFNIQFYDPGSGMSSVNWTLSDFVIMGVLLFGTGLVLDLIMRNTSKYRTFAVIATILLFLFFWAELAVGIFNIPGISGN